MKKRFMMLLLMAAVLLPLGLRAQVTIGGTSDPQAGAILDLNSTVKGGLILSNVDITDLGKIPLDNGDLKGFTGYSGNVEVNTALAGTIVYNTYENAEAKIKKGLYVWDGEDWQPLSGTSGGSPTCAGAPIVGDLTAANVCAGNNLTKAANVISDNGSAVTGYEWKLGGTTIGTSATLSYAVQTADNGKALTLSVTNICGTTTTTGVALTVAATLTQPNPTAAAATICIGTGTTINCGVATGGVGAYTYSWEKSEDGTNFTVITSSNVQNYPTGNLTADTWFHRIATAATCGTNTSAAVKVTVRKVFAQGNPTGATINTGTTHAFTLAAPTGGSGNVTYQWEQSEDNSSWGNADGESASANYTTPTLTRQMYYRRKATDTTCSVTITSGSALVKVTNCTSVTDAEGHIYTASEFGPAGCWMTQNLRSTWTMQGSTFRSIPKGINSGNANSPYYYFPNATVDTINHPEYGLLYTWAAANIGTSATEASDAFSGMASTRQGICPSGWHLPSDYEWNQLEKEIATNPSAYSTQNTPFAWNSSYESNENLRPGSGSTHTYWGRQMKSTTAVGNAPNGSSKTNSAGGFDALLVGHLFYGTTDTFGNWAIFWSSSAKSSTEVLVRLITYSESGVRRYVELKGSPSPIRCVKTE
ncbi:MAG: fibrobacter succinogenes major paralogous domain-containing protein [Candidatus Symbiothrix sp.]|nr:fibrobacter succinogenes major paralogous domain-containing protein [Candidatus Symbiothrix sp.]